jgi:hypothetical protein
LAVGADHAAELARFRALAPQTFAPRVPPTDASLTKLKWHSMAERSAPASKPDGDPFDVVFCNERKTPVHLYWMDRQGAARLYGTIPAGQRKRQNTRPGAVWFITDSEDNPLGYFVVDDRTARAMIPEAQRKPPPP